MSNDVLSFEEFKHLSRQEQCERYKELSENDRFKARISQPPALGYVMCNDCIHYHKDASCDAFRCGIPMEIFIRDEHDTPFCGDNGIRFEPVLKREK